MILPDRRHGDVFGDSEVGLKTKYFQIGSSRRGACNEGTDVTTLYVASI